METDGQRRLAAESFFDPTGDVERSKAANVG